MHDPVTEMDCLPAGPVVKGFPGRLDGAHDAFFEMLRVLLHDDDGLLERILFLHLLLKLAGNQAVGVPGVFF